MKQNITVEQIDELSEKGKKRLKKWAISHKFAYIYDDRYVFGVPFGWNDLPLLSIGQMIQFLDEKWGNIYFPILRKTKRRKRGKADEWNITMYNGKPRIYYKELADALWEATKEVLNG